MNNNDISQKTVSILGSTGSIGCSAVAVLEQNLDLFKVKFLAANNNYELLAQQAEKLMPESVVIVNEDYYSLLKSKLSHLPISVYSGLESLLSLCEQKCDVVISSITGCAGLLPTWIAISSGSNIALANKESLVCAGSLLIEHAKQNKVKIIPVDSEHNAIMQILDLNRSDLVDKIILTASGGPFLKTDISDLTSVTLSQALKHPTWKMGKKISIDSATMFNKGLELIEAHHLFDIAVDNIDIIIHPQSIIHSMVSYKNGVTIAQMSQNDMQIPISVALFWPNKFQSNLKCLNFEQISELNFFPLDTKKFPAIGIVKQAIKQGGNAPLVINAANEVAVQYFLSEKINFVDIAKIVENMLEIIEFNKLNSLDDVVEQDKFVQSKTRELIERVF